MSETQTPFHKERQQTDDSLTTERGKTDESFENFKGEAESKADKAVVKNRLEADKARLKRRFEADTYNQKHSAADQKVISERKSEDSAIKTERSKNDLAIRQERGEKEKILNKLVDLEREATDQNLLCEREKTDLEAKLSAKLLTVEQAAHVTTQSALTTREEFVAIVSHDLRNPIGAILSSADLLLENSKVDQEVKQLVEIIKRNAEVSLRMISDILDMERIAEGKIKLQLTSCRLNEVLEQAIESNKHNALNKKINLSFEPVLTAELFDCDKDRIAQVLSNLIGNAIKFTPAGGEVSVSAESSADEITVSVKDSGPGIPKEQKDRVFEKFAQLKNKNRQGIGLGLYISKTLIESHRGKIWIAASSETGSTFSFTLPK